MSFAMRGLIVVIGLLTAVLACHACHEAAAPSTPVATSEGQPVKDIEQPPLPLPSERISTKQPETLLDGHFVSDGCGPRKYRRSIQFQKDAHFSASDIPHPCKDECVVQWTVERHGTFALEGEDAIKLTIDGTVDPQKQVGDTTPFPSTFLVHDGALTEPGPVACRYRHVK
jgi:hypothetical protein